MQIFEHKAKVGGIVYSIRPLDRIAKPSDGDVGQHRPARRDILIADRMPRSLAAKTLIYEILHATSHDRVLKLDEDTVERLARGAAAFIVDNPELCKTIGEYLLKE